MGHIDLIAATSRLSLQNEDDNHGSDWCHLALPASLRVFVIDGSFEKSER
jgi:hypothetical protein